MKIQFFLKLIFGAKIQIDFFKINLWRENSNVFQIHFWRVNSNIFFKINFWRENSNILKRSQFSFIKPKNLVKLSWLAAKQAEIFVFSRIFKHCATGENGPKGQSKEKERDA